MFAPCLLYDLSDYPARMSASQSTTWVHCNKGHTVGAMEVHAMCQSQEVCYLHTGCSYRRLKHAVSQLILTSHHSAIAIVPLAIGWRHRSCRGSHHCIHRELSRHLQPPAWENQDICSRTHGQDVASQTTGTDTSDNCDTWVAPYAPARRLLLIAHCSFMRMQDCQCMLQSLILGMLTACRTNLVDDFHTAPFCPVSPFALLSIIVSDVVGILLVELVPRCPVGMIASKE